MLNVLLSVAQWEREAIGERTRDALQHKRRQGKRAGQIPFGRTLAEDGDTLLVNPREQAIVELSGVSVNVSNFFKTREESLSSSSCKSR